VAVVDASVWIAAWLLDDVNHQPASGWLLAYIASGRATYVPAIALAEVAGATARRTASDSDGIEAAERMSTTPRFQMLPVSVARADAAFRLAAELRIRGADAVYAALAQELAQPLVTLDGELAQRTEAIIPVVVPGQ